LGDIDSELTAVHDTVALPVPSPTGEKVRRREAIHALIVENAANALCSGRVRM
jgi:hypothetical protein